MDESQLIYGCYPAIVKTSEKPILLRQIYQDYIKQDIIKILNGAEVDVVSYKNENCIISIEVKFKIIRKPIISRSFRSFIEAYKLKIVFFITKNSNKKIEVNNYEIYFISLSRLFNFF